jgi:hypothetical protein
VADDYELHTWRWTSEKYCTKAAALKECFPDTLAKSPTLRALVREVERAEAEINSIMIKLAEESIPDE